MSTPHNDDAGDSTAEDTSHHASRGGEIDIEEQPFNINDSPPDPSELDDDEHQSRFDEEYHGGIRINENTK